MGHVPVPLHYVHLKSDLVSGRFKVAVQPSLPGTGVSLILGNDIAGVLFPACVVTGLQSRRLGGVVVGLNDTVFDPVFREDSLASLCPCIVGQHSKPIVHFVIQAPNLAQMNINILHFQILGQILHFQILGHLECQNCT